MRKAKNSYVKPNKPNWDEIFLTMARTIGSASHCVSRKVGALIVRDGRIISSGINGTPAGVANCDELFPIPGRGTGFDRATHHRFSLANEVHAEMNAILFAARTGIAIDGATLYCSMQPCDDCMKNLLQSGLGRVVYAEKYDLANWSDFIKAAAKKKKLKIEYMPLKRPA